MLSLFTIYGIPNSLFQIVVSQFIGVESINIIMFDMKLPLISFIPSI